MKTFRSPPGRALDLVEIQFFEESRFMASVIKSRRPGGPLASFLSYNEENEKNELFHEIFCSFKNLSLNVMRT